MTVAELIAELQKYDGDLEVRLPVPTRFGDGKEYVSASHVETDYINSVRIEPYV